MNITMLVSRLFKLFIPSNIEKIAKASGFMKRHSKLLPETFAKVMTLGLLDSKNITEEVLVTKCAMVQNEVSLTKQAIGSRIQNSIPFLKELLKSAFSIIYDNALGTHSSSLLKFFSDVKILDATTISLPDKVADDYTGMGGRNAKASLKIQALYSVISNSMTYFDITSGVVHDTTALPNIIETLSEKELFMADLGYFDTNQLRKIGEKSFFVSRIKTNTKVFDAVSEKHSIYKHINTTKLLKSSTDYIDKEVYIGTDSSNKLNVRLVGTKLPDSVAHKRIQKAIANNGGNSISDEKREILHWNLMITNISKDTLNTRIIAQLYRIRWQIELLFKVFKSTFSIDKLHVSKTKYVEAILYGRLVGILLTMPLYDGVNTSMLFNKGRGVSMQRFYNSLSSRLSQIYAIKKVTLHTYYTFGDIILEIGNKTLHEKRKRKTTYARIESYLNEILEIGKT